jgi:hypothetical protein
MRAEGKRPGTAGMKERASHMRAQAIFTEDSADVSGRAVFSPCGLYRYTLERAWAQLPRYVLWIMHNPSTADAAKNDATIRRCIGYARAWGYTGILVGNLYAWRSTSPRALYKIADPIGPENEQHVRGLVRRASLVVCAWGEAGPHSLARFNVLQLLRPGADRGGLAPIEPHVLRLNTTNAEPSHPLRLAKSLEPKRWGIFDNMGNGYGG